MFSSRGVTLSPLPFLFAGAIAGIVVTVLFLLIATVVIIIIVVVVAKIVVDRRSKLVESTDEVDVEGTALFHGTDETDSGAPQVSVALSNYVSTLGRILKVQRKFRHECEAILTIILLHT